MKHEITFDSLTEDQKEQMTATASKLITKQLITAAGIKVAATVVSAVLVKVIAKKLDATA